MTARCLEQQAYDDNRADKEIPDDHQNDATGYPIAYEMPIRKPVVISLFPKLFDTLAKICAGFLDAGQQNTQVRKTCQPGAGARRLPTDREQLNQKDYLPSNHDIG